MLSFTECDMPFILVLQKLDWKFAPFLVVSIIVVKFVLGFHTHLAFATTIVAFRGHLEPDVGDLFGEYNPDVAVSRTITTTTGVSTLKRLMLRPQMNAHIRKDL